MTSDQTPEPLPVNAGDDGRWGGATPLAVFLDELAGVHDEVWADVRDHTDRDR